MSGYCSLHDSTARRFVNSHVRTAARRHALSGLCGQHPLLRANVPHHCPAKLIGRTTSVQIVVNNLPAAAGVCPQCEVVASLRWLQVDVSKFHPRVVVPACATHVDLRWLHGARHAFTDVSLLDAARCHDRLAEVLSTGLRGPANVPGDIAEPHLVAIGCLRFAQRQCLAAFNTIGCCARKVA